MKKIIYILLPIICVIIATYFIFSNSKENKLKDLNYNNEAISKINDFNIYEIVIKEKYSKTLETALLSDDYNSKYVNDYIKINYVDDKNFIKDINKLLDIGYSVSQINTIYEQLEYDNIKYILENNHIDNLEQYLSLEYFKNENLSRYIDYSKKNNTNVVDTITYVNMNLDYDFYSNIEKVTNPDDLLVVVDKYNQLPSDYEPSNLVLIDSSYSTGNNYIRSEAKIPFETLCSDAKKEGLYIKAMSTYRSYKAQDNIYNGYVNRNGRESADTYSARPGHSEHQTGLAIDVMNNTTSYTNFGSTKEYKWMMENAYKYGFTLSYPSDKVSITGYISEPWHYRYVGVEIATYLHQNNLTLGEYMARKNK